MSCFSAVSCTLQTRELRVAMSRTISESVMFTNFLFSPSRGLRSLSFTIRSSPPTTRVDGPDSGHRGVLVGVHTMTLAPLPPMYPFYGQHPHHHQLTQHLCTQPL